MPNENTPYIPPKVILALNVALATRRPLVISGEPGSGKSSLALNVHGARSRLLRKSDHFTYAATDLLWSFDALRRLSDATAGAQFRELPATSSYVEPGPLWWAFDPVGAASSRGLQTTIDPGLSATDGQGQDAVLLLDEIDKADPDVPNDLLEPIGAKSFTVKGDW